MPHSNVLIFKVLLTFLFFFSSGFARADVGFEHGVNVSHWMAQHAEGKYASKDKFDASDAKWIASEGYDHLRIPVDGRILFNTQGQLITEMLQPFSLALSWAKENELGVIFDMHYLPGNAFLNEAEDNLLWKDPHLMQSAADFWRQLAEFYKGEGGHLRFELLNEAVAPKNEDVNRMNRALVSAIREVDTERVLYVSSNLWGQFSTAEDVHVFEDDQNVHYTFHYYHPMLFTHQKASWTDFGRLYDKSVSFPDRLGDLQEYFPEGHYALTAEHTEISEEKVIEDFQALSAWARKNDVKVLLSEFGVINHADDESKARWASLVRRLCKEHGFGWSVWDYQSDFAVRGVDGEGTATHHALTKD